MSNAYTEAMKPDRRLIEWERAAQCKALEMNEFLFE
jgi:hypothetical protein